MAVWPWDAGLRLDQPCSLPFGPYPIQQLVAGKTVREMCSQRLPVPHNFLSCAPCGWMTHSHPDCPECRWCGFSAVWLFGGVACRRCGSPAVWLAGGVACWRCGLPIVALSSVPLASVLFYPCDFASVPLSSVSLAFVAHADFFRCRALGVLPEQASSASCMQSIPHPSAPQR